MVPALIALLWACDHDKGQSDADDTDAVVDDSDTDEPDTDEPDTESDDDTEPDDTEVPDTDVADTDVADTPEDTDEPGPTCAFLDFGYYPVDCGGTWGYLVEWYDPNGTPGCDTYFTVNGRQNSDPVIALATSGCSNTCVYRPNTSVMLLYCGVRGEYIEYLDGAPGQDPATLSCDPLYEVNTIAGSAWVRSLAEYEATHPCP